MVCTSERGYIIVLSNSPMERLQPSRVTMSLHWTMVWLSLTVVITGQDTGEHMIIGNTYYMSIGI